MQTSSMQTSHSHSLQAEKIEKAISELEQGIHEILPGRKIGDVCHELREVAREAHTKSLRNKSSSFTRNKLLKLFLIAALILIVTSLITFGLSYFLREILTSLGRNIGIEEGLQMTDTAITLLLPSIAYIFYRLKDNIKTYRTEVLNDLHKLRMLSHIIDVKQLNKTPDWIDWKEEKNKHDRKLNARQIAFYLEFCSQMQSLIGKIAVLYIRDVNDPALITAVNEIETLTTGLSRKTWQKLMLMQKHQVAST